MLLSIIENALCDLKAIDMVVLDVSALTDVMDTMIIVSATSHRHVKSIAEHVAFESKQQGYPIMGMEGEEVAEWVLLDYGDIVVHIMLPKVRDFYDLEALWCHQQVASLVNA